jgi:predicted CoA-binding protein
MGKRTVVLGASTRSDRYAFLAATKLKRFGHTVFPVGLHEGEIEGTQILTGQPRLDDIDTVTLYVGPANQKHWLEYILSLKPKRIIFNPGTENPELYKLAAENGIETVTGCTLVMLSIGAY